MTRTKELPNSTNLLHTPTVLPLYTTEKEITKPGTNTPDRRWNMPLKPSSARKKLIGNQRSQRVSHKRCAPAAATRESRTEL
jgi:hypothetical protein